MNIALAPSGNEASDFSEADEEDPCGCGCGHAHHHAHSEDFDPYEDGLIDREFPVIDGSFSDEE